MKRPFRAPLNIPFGKYSVPLTAIVGALATFSVWCLVVITKPQGRYLGIAWMTFGLIMYFAYRRSSKLKPTGHIAIEKISIPDFQPMSVRKILLPVRGGTQTETVQMACEIAKLHKAKVTALHVIEIPASLPLDISTPHRNALAEAILKRAEAIARDLGVEIELNVMRARFTSDSILEMATKGRYDLLVLGTLKSSKDKTKGLGATSEKVLRKASCRVWVCASEAEKGKRGKTLLA